MERVENPGTFSISGKLTSIPPGLKVKDFGIVSLPFIEHQAEALIKLSEQAPFGRGEETIVDTKVRNVWQIPSENFELTNPQWEESLQESVEQMGKQLGLYGCKINFEQYKLAEEVGDYIQKWSRSNNKTLILTYLLEHKNCFFA